MFSRNPDRRRCKERGRKVSCRVKGGACPFAARGRSCRQSEARCARSVRPQRGACVPPGTRCARPSAVRAGAAVFPVPTARGASVRNAERGRSAGLRDFEEGAVRPQRWPALRRTTFCGRLSPAPSAGKGLHPREPHFSEKTGCSREKRGPLRCGAARTGRMPAVPSYRGALTWRADCSHSPSGRR